MNANIIKNSLVTILKTDTELMSYVRDITDNYVENPYLNSNKALIEVTSGNLTQTIRQPFGYSRYDLIVILRIFQRNTKMSDSESTLDNITSRLLYTLDQNRKKITGVNGINNMTIVKDLESTDVDTRITEVQLSLDILEER